MDMCILHLSVTLLKKDFKQKEDKFLEEFLDIKKLKDKIEDRLYKQDQSVQTKNLLIENANLIVNCLSTQLLYDVEKSRCLDLEADIGIFVGYAPSRKGYRIYNKRTRRLIETIHVTFDEMHQSVAPVRISSGPEPFIMTPEPLKSGLAPTDKELEMLFQPMFDEHLEHSRVNEPVPSATADNAQVVPLGTSLSTIIAQDAL
ncbi:hypothetical protein Tco_1098395, partial [Tanacetum coccineum]